MRGLPEDPWGVQDGGWGTQAHIPALRTGGSRAAESDSSTKLPPTPDFPKAESRLGSQGLQGRPAVSRPGSQRAPELGGRSQEKLSRPGMAVHPHPFPSGSGGTRPGAREQGAWH